MPTPITRREALRCAVAGAGAAVAAAASTRACAQQSSSAATRGADKRVPVIDITDLYHPAQDVGDNLDLIAAYALPEVDLKAIVLDVTQLYRQAYTGAQDPAYNDPTPARDPGFIPVAQLNYLFGRLVPCGLGPFTALRSTEDAMEDAPPAQQTGVQLILDTLRASADPVDIVSFGSARALAVAYNRAPDLLREKVRMAHVCAGAAPAGYLEWNVYLDKHAFVRVLRSDLPLAVYPCATDKGPFDYGRNNSFWRLPDLGFVREMHPALRRYIAYALARSTRVDFLRAIEEDIPGEDLDKLIANPHSVWETAVWAQVAHRRIVRRPDGTHRLVPAHELTAADVVLPNELAPCRFRAHDDGQFEFELTSESVQSFIYDRGDALANERALREALPALYRSFSL